MPANLYGLSDAGDGGANDDACGACAGDGHGGGGDVIVKRRPEREQHRQANRCGTERTCGCAALETPVTVALVQITIIT